MAVDAFDATTPAEASPVSEGAEHLRAIKAAFNLGAIAGSIARRTATGTLVAAPAVEADELMTLGQLPEMTGTAAPTGDSLARRTATGTLRVAQAAASDEAIAKAQFDAAVNALTTAVAALTALHLPYAGSYTATPSPHYLPAGWTVQKMYTGVYRITHNLGTNEYDVLLCPAIDVRATVVVHATTYFEVHSKYQEAYADTGLRFRLFRR
jgi:hypothetical protein